ncbi:hypothetical protein M427DRAFT_49127 [Gonapodya prolifera JEL478]|uniref:Uncharacterized protein n=1 Tax=Gonapodya prolifera (strain JEL478) TaxID=1344416 RepID=A0A138ZZ38_GONPJ|nr:hypothetical protein M427DRAFT_49127 [Gonapodya prolifera JEL478]|eukprot:KXS09751.1 hypothetical protein M427DRAFT_49127 [Gonapodya prolifera JEL478]
MSGLNATTLNPVGIANNVHYCCYLDLSHVPWFAIQTLKKLIIAAYGIYSLRSIFEFDSNTYPLLNLSSKTAFNYFQGTLGSNIVDTTWTVDGYIFSITTLTLYKYRYIIVSGAEIHTTQDNFMAMIKVFAEALMQNKALANRRTTSAHVKSVVPGEHIQASVLP